MPKNARVRSNRICFTLNNYTPEDKERIQQKLQDYHKDGRCKYGILGYEKGESGTPHIQGFLHMDGKPKDCGLKWWREKFGELSRAHIENARGSDGDNDKYCSKDGDCFRVGVPLETCGKWEQIADAASRGLDAIREQDAEFYCKSFFQARAMVDYELTRKKPEPLEVELRDWQQQAVAKLTNQSTRQITFVVDEVGGKGKTLLASYLSRNLNAFRCGGGKHADLAYMWTKREPTTEMVAIDLTRTLDPQYYPYHFMEDLKNGFMTSTKYTSTSFEFPPQKVIVFTNQMPDKTKLSADRYEIYII